MRTRAGNLMDACCILTAQKISVNASTEGESYSSATQQFDKYSVSHPCLNLHAFAQQALRVC